MVHCSNHCKCILTASGSTSCSEIVDHCFYKRCNPTCCLDQCEFISDRNYAILRKICTKIFKEYNRAKCREKYTIFDGGNSINVRIHRSGTRGNEINHRYEKTSAENFYITDHSNKGDKQTATKAGKEGKQPGFDAYEPDINGNKNSNLQSSIRGRTRDRGNNDNDGQIKSNQRYKKKLRSFNGNEFNEEHKEKTATGKQNSKKRLSSEVTKSQSRKAKNSYNEDTDNYVDEKYTKNIKTKTGIKSKRNSGAIVTLDDDEKGSKQKHKKKIFKHKSNEEIEKSKNTNSQNFISADVKISADSNIISNLRRKVRMEEKFGFNTELSSDKMKTSKTSKYQAEKNLQYRKSKPSRADEVKACDYLRAQMEERELCKLNCAQQISQCVPYTCIPPYCPKTIIPCYSETCKCEI